jgi:hypothetical protein
MRHLLISAAVAGTVLTPMPPAEAKSIWLKCGGQEINLDSTKERFSLTSGSEIFQGRAMFSPGQINFEFTLIATTAGSGVKRAYAIDRKSLEYTEKLMLKFIGDSWSTSSSTAGKCSIMKTPPTAGNQI